MVRGRKTGAPVWPYDADYIRVTPTFREGSSCFVVLFIEARKAKERQTEREKNPRLWMYYTAVTDGYAVPRGQQHGKVGFGRMDFILRYFRRLFITVVSYCCARQRSVKWVQGFSARLENIGYKEAVDILISDVISVNHSKLNKLYIQAFI